MTLKLRQKTALRNLTKGLLGTLRLQPSANSTNVPVRLRLLRPIVSRTASLLLDFLAAPAKWVAAGPRTLHIQLVHLFPECLLGPGRQIGTPSATK